jgi:hypothetical protein
LNMPPTHRSEQDDRDLAVVFDERLDRFYITYGNLLVAVLELSRMEFPRLPSSTYGLGTEYERCHKLLEKSPSGRRTLGVKGKRRLTG